MSLLRVGALYGILHSVVLGKRAEGGIIKTMSRTIKGLIHRPDLRWSLLALSIYTVTTLVMMYPVPFRLNSVVAGEGYGDAYQYVWQLWWARQALLDPGKGLAHITLMNHPAGVDHPFMLTMIGVDLLALPFTVLFSPAAAYNGQILLAFILSGMAMYWLGVELTGDRRAGLVGGFIFAFFLNKTGHVLGGHLPQVTVYCFPLYALLLWRAVRKPGWSTALATAFVLALASLIHVMHLVYLVLPVTAATLLAALVEMRGAFFTWRRLGSLALIFGLAVLIVVPFLLPTLLEFVGDDSYLYKAGVVKSSTDLLAFFTPSRYHPVLGRLGLLPPFAEQVFADRVALCEGLAYPGILALGLAVWGLVRQRRRVWIWGVLALMAAVLSLGPLLKVGGELVRYQVEVYQSLVVLPYGLLKQMPVLEVGRTPGRLNETTMFAIAILASYGMAELSALLARRPRLLASLLTALLIGTGLEYISIWPFPTSTAEIPPVLQRIASEPGHGALLHIPMPRKAVDNRALYYQTAVPRPIVRGYIHRTPPEVPPWSETLSGLAQPDQTAGDVVPRPDLSGRAAWLRYFDVDYVVFHKYEAGAYASNYDYARMLLGPSKYEDHALAAFPVPVDALSPESPYLYTLSDRGWETPEQDGGFWRRWMCDDSWLYLYSTQEEVGSLSFTVDSYLEFPVLEVYVPGAAEEDQRLDSFVINGRMTYTTRPVTLTQGMNVFHFHTRGGGTRVLDDPRCWSRALIDPPASDALLLCSPEALRTTCRTLVFDRVVFVPHQGLSEGDGLNVNLGDQMHLRGWRLEATELHPGEALTVTLAWEATVALSDQHVVFVHMLSPDGTLVAQHDAPPVGRLLPASAWPPGTVFSYPVAIEVPDGLPAGDYPLLVGVYLWPSLERLPVLAGVPGAEANTVELGSVRIAP